ncbi:MIP/aquaporin family protein [Salisediminibacterium halotolerans]|uniref:MIP/aquaporin family protein n=1 Tax=Salisediminibacterium halotolerans TaxID=517425 RepID=UPI000EAE0EF6|nr:MIP/aquaporin family protein [Salisediminibacterium halotolerans]RLJ72343.1 glycerol uptake facilitator protein [Actinophytocola xinjiangensis]RPE85557.1 glycerol uptake facilitator protein [Salisediminibacterium halotolerans]TWG33512.1 glycerol uptake facilitator protein [Salisediminibacterium halotolerans]GEL08523.1 glycerol transporter [Salisediminibacterium halotolerans]
MSPLLAEFIGTMMLIVFGGGVVAGVVLKGTKSEGAGWVLISFAWGLGVAMSVYMIGDISGGHINPAVTVGSAVVGDFAWSMVPGYIAAQVTGAFTGGALIFAMYYPHFKATEDQGAKHGVFATAPAIKHTPSNFFSEVLGTYVLLFGIMALGAGDMSAGLDPLVTGFLIVVIGMSLGGTTGYAINPARDLGPRIAHALLPIPRKGNSGWSYAWIPIAGPIIGGSLGTLSYVAFFNGIIYPALWLFILLFITVQGLTIWINKKDAVAEDVDETVHNKAKLEAQ